MSQIFNVGVSPSHIAIDTNGKYGYVTNSNNYGIPGSDNVSVLDLTKGHTISTIHDDSFVEPYRVAVSDKFAYVCNSGSPANIGDNGTVTIIELSNNEVLGVITGFDGPGGIVLSKNYAYVTNYGANGGAQSGNGKTVSVVDLKKNIIIKTIETDLAPSALVLSSDEKYLYVTCYMDGNPGTGTLNIIRTSDNSIVRKIAGFSGPFGIDLTPDNKFAYVTNFGSNNFAPYGTTVSCVSICLCSQHAKIVKNIEVGIQPSGVQVSKDGCYVYVVCYNALYAKPNYQQLTYGEGTLTTIRTKNNKIVGTSISVGQTPSTITLSTDGDRLYVCKYVQGTILGINL